MNLISAVRRFLLACVLMAGVAAPLAQAQTTTLAPACEDAAFLGLLKPKEVEMTEQHAALGPYDKVYAAASDGGVLREERLCSNEIDLPSLSKLTMFGKLHGLFRHSNGWSGRDFELYDNDGRLRIIKTNVTFDFERVLLLDSDGRLIAPSGTSNFAWTGAGATFKILEEYSKGNLPEAAVLLWLLTYHGEGQGADNNAAFAHWFLNNADKGLALVKGLDRDLSTAIGRDLAYGLDGLPVKAGENTAMRFADAVKPGTSVATDNALKLLESLRSVQ